MGGRDVHSLGGDVEECVYFLPGVGFSCVVKC